MSSSIIFYKELTAAEVGKTKTHEVYIRLPNDFDYISFFNNSATLNGSVIESNITATDLTHDSNYKNSVELRFVYFANSNKEKRIPSLGSIFKIHDVDEGDIVKLERKIESGVPKYYITFYKKDSLKLKPAAIYLETTEDNILNLSLPKCSSYIESRQIIYYGAPGTGKSYKIKKLVREGNHVRTTFHPDSDYASFVGAYKPTMNEVPSRDVSGHIIIENGNKVKEKKIVYEFVAQAFLQAYTEAWKRSVGIMTDKEGINMPMPEGMDDKYYLVIEEINRGNCAQIFGDLFQLLDRDDNGESSYAIRPDQDIKRYLAEQFIGIEALPDAIRRGGEMKLPSNLYILATMNTSDQSLFPIDSAFKRRWDWEYVPIKDEKKGYYIKVGDTAYLWSDFLLKINEKILDVTHSDDKQMGYWFVHLPEGQKEISTDKFVGKVLFYLWNDVFKDFGDGEDTIFIGEKDNGEKYELRFKHFFGSQRDERIKDLMRYNKVEETPFESDSILEIANEEGLEEDTPSQDGEPSAKGLNHMKFWSMLKKRLNDHGIINDSQKAGTDNWHNITLGLTGVYICLKHNVRDNIISAEVWFEKKYASNFFTFVNNDKAHFEEVLTSAPTWRSTSTVNMVGWENHDFDLSTNEGENGAKEWAATKAEELAKVIKPLITQFKSDQ